MRTLIDLPDAQIEALSSLCDRAKLSRSAVIRDAVAEYLKHHAVKPTGAAFGLWGDEAADGLAYQEKARAEW